MPLYLKYKTQARAEEMKLLEHLFLHCSFITGLLPPIHVMFICHKQNRVSGLQSDLLLRNCDLNMEEHKLTYSFLSSQTFTFPLVIGVVRGKISLRDIAWTCLGMLADRPFNSTPKKDQSLADIESLHAVSSDLSCRISDSVSWGLYPSILQNVYPLLQVTYHKINHCQGHCLFSFLRNTWIIQWLVFNFCKRKVHCRRKHVSEKAHFRQMFYKQ
jgi:hypothetical protein